jgi:hypothetical protein
VPQDILTEWAQSVGVTLGDLIPGEGARRKVLLLLYAYRHLDGLDLANLPATDLITHRVRIAPGTKPANNPHQKRWPQHTEWWLRKLVSDGVDGGIYESTITASGRLSPWNARAIVVDKVENPTPEDEPRITFDYSRVTEVLPGSYLELSSKVHDNLSDPRHRCFFAADLKHAYFTIPLHPDDRKYFAFTISGLGQLQPTRMMQGSQSAGFTMTEAVNRACGPLPPPHKEPSLLHSAEPSRPPVLVFYMDDFFGGFSGFNEQYDFLREHFLPRMEWARFKLSFKKLKLFVSEIKCLGMTHTIGGKVKVLEDRVSKIARWPVPYNQTAVRSFLGVLGITRRWIKNYAELARPLSRLTGKLTWRWGLAEQLSFEVLKIKCATRSSMHGIDMSLVVHFYTDASGFAVGVAITQFQQPAIADTRESNQLVEVPVVYDSITLTPTRRKYPTYKRELYAITTFTKRYDYLCKHPYHQAIVHTDHRPLTYFLQSDLHDGIYGHWADQLRRLNLKIVYIPGHRNKVADGLSRTLFDTPDCASTPTLAEVYDKLTNEGPKWVWRDGKGGFDEFLSTLDQTGKQEVFNLGTLDGVPVFSTAVGTLGWAKSYQDSLWFGDIYNFLSQQHDTPPTPALLRKAFNYRIHNSILWIHRYEDIYLPCIPEGKVLAVLTEAHDDSGHWAKTGTMARLRGLCYWPNQSQDVEAYIAGCLICARHGTATRSQPLHPVVVTHPFQLMGMDFIGPLEKTPTGNTFVLNLGCYMSRYSVPMACVTDYAEDVVRCLRWFFAMYRKPHAFYVDCGHHFNNQLVRSFLHSEGVTIDYSPSASHKSTGMIENMNRTLESVIRKSGQAWDDALPASASAINSRIIGHLGVSPRGVVFGPLVEPSSVQSTILSLPGRDILAWATELSGSAHTQAVHTYLRHRAEVHDVVSSRSKEQKEEMALRYNKGVKRVVHHLGDLVMLYQERTRKLQPRWRGPFRISGYGGSHGVSFTLIQLNGRGIKGTFHGDHLRRFVPRTGYLAGLSPPSFLPQQTIRERRRVKEKRAEK